MKCVQYLKTNKIDRVSDEEAADLHRAGQVKYVPKALWKKEVRDVDRAKASG